MALPGLTRGAADKRYPPSGVPSNAGTRTGRYEPRLSLYNWKPSNTRKLHASLSTALAGTSIVDWLFLGDSKTAGYSGGSLQAWPRMLGAALAARGYVIGGAGFSFPGGLATVSDSRWTLNSWSNNGLAYAQTTTTNPLTFASTGSDIGTKVGIAYLGSSGPFTVTVDGSTPPGTPTVTNGTYSAGTVTPTGSSVNALMTITGLSSATHTVVITPVSGTARIVAVSVYGAGGLLIHNAGAYGSTSAYLVPSTFPNPRFTILGAVPAPSAVFLSAGINDTGASITTTTTNSNLNTVVTALKALTSAPDVVLVVESAGQASGTWDAYVKAQYDLADTLDLPLVDWTDRFGANATAKANNIISADSIHETSVGYLAEARHLAAALGA